MSKIIKQFAGEVKVIDEAKGLVEYVASDESVDSDREVVLAKGWRFDRMEKNAPFLDSHARYGIQHVLGKVVDWRVEGKRLIETVQWAIDVPENRMAAIGFAMTVAGYLKAVSVGFMGVKWLTARDAGWGDLAAEYKFDPQQVWRVFTEQQQFELSAVVVGANANAVARAYQKGVLKEPELDFLCEEAQRAARMPEDGPEAGERTRAKAAILAQLLALR